MTRSNTSASTPAFFAASIKRSRWARVSFGVAFNFRFAAFFGGFMVEPLPAFAREGKRGDWLPHKSFK